MAAHSNAFTSLGEPPKLAAGNWAGIIDTLYQEHGYILSLLEALEQQATKLARGKIPDYLILKDMIDYLLNYPDQYHHPREDLLFASLQRINPDFQPHYERLQREHRTLHKYNKQLYRELNQIVGGSHADKQRLQHELKKYISGYRKHLHFESKDIFPEARGSLSKKQLKEIEAKTRYHDDPLFKRLPIETYQRLSRRLKQQEGDLQTGLLASDISTLEHLREAVSETIDSIKDQPCKVRLPKRTRSVNQPSWQARTINRFTRTLIKPVMRFGTIDAMRSLTARYQKLQEKNLPEDLCWKHVSTENYEGDWIHIARKRPKKVLLYLPGGAFIIRTEVQHRDFVGRICRSANCKALLVHYRLAPETPFPGGLEDCLAAYHDLLDQGIAPEDITIGGDSAGGGLVLSTLLALRDEKTPMPAAAIVLSPLADLTYSGESRKFNKYLDPMLPTHRSSNMHQLYVGDALSEDRYLSPVLTGFDGFPPILGQVGSTEILLSDTVRAAERAKEAGVPFVLDIWEQMPHAFPLFGVLPESKVAVERIAKFIVDRELDPLPICFGRNNLHP